MAANVKWIIHVPEKSENPTKMAEHERRTSLRHVNIFYNPILNFLRLSNTLPVSVRSEPLIGLAMRNSKSHRVKILQKAFRLLLLYNVSLVSTRL